MKRSPLLVAAAALLTAVPGARGYVEVPYTLGRVCSESTNIVLVEVAKVNKEKGLIVFKKVKDLKGNHAQEIKHNIGQRGFHPREWQTIMAWAAEGKKAVFFHNGGASETCIGGYWYQCYPEGEWWGLSHAEPFLLRTYYGDAEKLAAAVTAIQAGKEVVVPCMADANKEQLHLRKGKMQRLKASLKLQEYDAKRDFVAWGGDGDDDIPEFKTFVLSPESAAGWRFVPAAQAGGDRWRHPDLDDRGWREGKAPVGYGEEEIARRKGTAINEKGQDFVFRRAFEVAADVLAQKGATFRVCVAGDDCAAAVYLNGELIDQEAADHEFAYWNREVEVPAKHFKAGRNVLAVLVKNKANSSDLYFDAEVSAQVPLPKPVKKPPQTGTPGGETKPGAAKPVLPEKPNPLVVIDKERKTVTVPCAVAPRKLPNLKDVYPIEVIATYPAPKGQKAHETVVTFGEIKPGDVHRALELLGLKPGKPAKGEGAKAEGPELKLYLEFAGADGKPQRVEIEKTLVHRDTGKPLPPLKWHFTGSSLKQPDPEKNDKAYGADLTGTLIALFPVTDDTVIQSHLTMKDEPQFKLETDRKLLPAEGTKGKLVIEAR
jgi:hypothetical protein